MFVGIFIGILIAFSIVWWQGNNISEWGVFKKVKSFFSNIVGRHDDHDVTVINENLSKQKISSAKQKITDQKLKNDSAFYDSTNINRYDPAALDEFLARYNGHLPDSLVLDSILKSQNNLDINSYNTASDIKVKQDKLIYAKSFSVPGIEMFAGDNPGKLDSLLTDNKTPIQNKNKNTLRVEFWKSPINYKGYKTGVNKLVLFGIDQFDMISFKWMNSTLFMKYMSDYYQIDKTTDFKSLVPISNPQLLSQLSSK
jgi:hypothetical protein